MRLKCVEAGVDANAHDFGYIVQGAVSFACSSVIISGTSGGD